MSRLHIEDSERWLIKALADYGFSYKLIISKVFSVNAIHHRKYYAGVARVLKQEGIRVRDYRNGETTIAKQIIKGKRFSRPIGELCLKYK